jgi:hypothetical protein
VICEKPEAAQGEREPCPQPEIRSGSVSPRESSPPTTPSLRPASGFSQITVDPTLSEEVNDPGSVYAPSLRPASIASEKDVEKTRVWHHDWTLDDHEWTLDELDHSVKDFPRHMLRLASPVMVFLRKSDEKIPVFFQHPFRRR